MLLDIKLLAAHVSAPVLRETFPGETRQAGLLTPEREHMTDQSNSYTDV